MRINEDTMLLGLVTIIILFFMIWLIIPKTHQGYYLYTSGNKLTEYKIVNNWKFFPDDVAVVTHDRDEAIRILNMMNKGGNSVKKN